MPIRPEERARYPKDWPAISKRVRSLAGNRCEWCHAPNGEYIRRLKLHPIEWVREDLVDGRCGAWLPPVRIVLTVAHLDHTPEHNDPENLAALCQRCHLTHDAKQHASTARDTRARKAGQGRLFA